LLALCPSVAHAQPHGTRAARAPAPAAAAPQTPQREAPAPNALPAPPKVSDPMLTPVPAPPRQVGSWQEALSYLRARSTDLRIALDQVLEAEAQTRIAVAAYLPTINATGMATHNFLTKTNTPQPPGSGPTTVTPTPDYLSGNVQAQQAIVNVPAFDQISIDELGERGARLSVEAEKRIIALSVANDIVAVATAERSAEINRVGLRVALEQVDIATRKHSEGIATGLDVVRATQNAANARAALVTGDESLREAREGLGLALGLPEEVGVAPSVNLDGIVESALASCRTVQDVDARPDVAQARVNLEVAKRNLRNVWFQFLPTLSAQSTLASTGQPVYSSLATTWNIQAVLSVSIWDGGARYGLLRNARAAEDIAAQTLVALRRQALVQVQQARRQLVVAQASYGVAKEQRDLAAQNEQMTQTAYTAGQATSLELVTASEAHRQAELNLALQEFGVVKARLVAALALASCPW
jgi:outer membrane protein TolC